jgi:hypothetical protein
MKANLVRWSRIAPPDRVTSVRRPDPRHAFKFACALGFTAAGEVIGQHVHAGRRASGIGR